MVQPKVIKTAVITTSVVAIGLGVGLTVGRSKSTPDNSSVQSDGGSPDVEYVDPSPKVSKDFMPAVVEETRNGDIVDTVDTIEAAQRYADMTGPEGGYAAYDVTDRQSASKAEKGSAGSGDGKSGKSNSGSAKGSSKGSHGGVVKCIGSGKSSKSNSDGKSGKSNSTGGGAGKSGKSNSRMLRGNRELPSDGGKSGKSGGYESYDHEWEGEWEEHKSWSSSSSTKWSSESTKWSSSSSSGDWKGEIVWYSSGKSGKSGHSDWGSSGKSGKSGHDDPGWEASWSSSSSDWGSVHVSSDGKSGKSGHVASAGGKSGKSGHHDPASWGSHSWSEPSWSHSSWSVDWVDCDPPAAKSSKSKSSKSKSGKAFTSKSSQAPTGAPTQCLIEDNSVPLDEECCESVDCIDSLFGPTTGLDRSFCATTVRACAPPISEFDFGAIDCSACTSNADCSAGLTCQGQFAVEFCSAATRPSVGTCVAITVPPQTTVAPPLVVPDPTSSPTPAPTQCKTTGNTCGSGNGECCGGLTCNGKICVEPKVFISTPEPSSSPTEGCEIIPESVKFCGTDDFTGCSVEGIFGDECAAASDADKGYDCETKSFYAPNSAGSETDGDCLKYTCDGSGNLSFMKNAFFDIVSRQCSCCPPPPEPPLVIVETDEPTMTPTTPSPTACSEDRVWYDNGSVCTNDGEFDEQSDTTFASMKLCCENTFGTNGECRFEDVCFTPAPTDEPTPNPTPNPTLNPVTPSPIEVVVVETPRPSPSPTTCEGRQWYIKTDKVTQLQCSNGYDIPEAAQDSMTFFASAAECCDEAFGVGSAQAGTCEWVDVCVPTSSPVTFRPTLMPTFGSTPTVSKETTGPPTMTVVPRNGKK